MKQLRWNCFEIVNAHMKKTALLILLFAVCLDGMSKSMAEIWRTMPDKIIPYIDAKHRTEMIDFIGLGQIGEVDNALQGKSSIVVVNANYLQAKLNEVTIVQLKRLSYIGGDFAWLRHGLHRNQRVRCHSTLNVGNSYSFLLQIKATNYFLLSRFPLMPKISCQ